MDNVPCGRTLAASFSKAELLGVEFSLYKGTVEGSFSLDVNVGDWRCGERDGDDTHVALCKRCMQVLGLVW